MRVLAVDCASPVLGLALADGGRRWRWTLEAAGRQDELLWGGTRRLLRRAGWALADLEALVAASGPGSFTGIRVGMTFVGMLAQALGRPAVAASLFEAEAFRAAGSGAAEGLAIVAVLPSRRGELFFQVFEHRPGRSPEPAGEPGWTDPAQWPSAFRQAVGTRRALLAGPGAEAAAGLLEGCGAEVRVLAGPPAGAAGLVPPAVRKLGRGAPGEFAPLYLKPPYYERRP